MSFVSVIREPPRAERQHLGRPARRPKYVSGIEGARLDVSANRLEWTVESIGPELEHTAAIKCSLATPGANRVQVYAIAADDLGASVETVTQVESVANLMMDVKNPESPVPVGEEVTYEVRLRNGTKEARDVAVFAYLSNGIEPTAAEGGPNRLSPGQVVFQPIKSLAPGIEVVLKVRARAVVGGNHIFWAEADCKPLGARLVSEVTNLYYANVSTTGQPTTRSLGSDAMAADDPVRTANRPVPSEKMQAPPRQ